MISNLNYLLVTATCLISVCSAIRVYWNTNTGPIIPPTPRTTIAPVPPFKEPAPVWQDLSNDIPNPNPYVYVPPPPSRPKQRLNTNVNYNSNDSSRKNYGTILTPQHSNAYNPQNINGNSAQVASLAAKYVPNVGTTYVAVVPTSNVKKSPASVNKYLQTLSPEDKTSYKLHGKYNVKTKKYKAYEKVKYAPHNYNLSHKSSENSTAPFDLPAIKIQKQWAAGFDSDHTTATPLKMYSPSKSYMKHVYAKDKMALKPKGKLDEFLDETKKS